MLQGGDIENNDGTGGESIYGVYFPDENFIRRHHSRGMLSMANVGPNTNSSQFFITYQAIPSLNGKNVVFGKLLKGWEILDAIEVVPIDHDDKPCSDISIRECGILIDEKNNDSIKNIKNTEKTTIEKIIPSLPPSTEKIPLTSAQKKLAELRELRQKVQQENYNEQNQKNIESKIDEKKSKKTQNIVVSNLEKSQVCINKLFYFSLFYFILFYCTYIYTARKMPESNSTRMSRMG